MRIAVLSDIHGNSVAFDRVVEDINNQNIEGIAKEEFKDKYKPNL